MASIIDSFRESFGDRFALLKVIVLAIPVFYSYQVYLGSKVTYGYFTFILSLTLFLLFGFLIEVTTNVINDHDSVLPSLNPLKLGIASGKGILAVAPITAISAALTNYICSFVNIIPWLDITIKIILWLIVGAIFLTSFLMFTQREKISDAYDIKFLLEKSGDLITTILIFLIQLIVINIPINGFIGYTLLVLFGFGPIFNFFLAMVLVFNLAVTGHYMAQVHYELFYDRSK